MASGEPVELPGTALPETALPDWAFCPEGLNVDTNVLGGGAYGCVYSATLHGLQVACKTLHMLEHPERYGLVGPGADPRALVHVLREFEGEAAALAAVRHPHVLRFWGVGYTYGDGGGGGGQAVSWQAGLRNGGIERPWLPKWIVTERLPHSLHDLIHAPVARQDHGVPLQPSHALCFAIDIAEGLAYLHSIGMIHRDLKSKNVLVGEAGCKIADLGVAKIVGVAASTAQHTVGPGTAIYHPPEAITGRYTAALDVYSLGCCILEAVLCESPERSSASDPLPKAQLERVDQRGTGLGAVVAGCCKMDPQQRWQCAQALRALLGLARELDVVGQLESDHAQLASGVSWGAAAAMAGQMWRSQLYSYTSRRRLLLRASLPPQEQAEEEEEAAEEEEEEEEDAAPDHHQPHEASDHSCNSVRSNCE
jgi:serine/threonine protein kinase